MTRFILSLMMFLFVFARHAPARTELAAPNQRDSSNSKGASFSRPASPIATRTLIQSSKNAALSSIGLAASSVRAMAQAGRSAVEGRLARLTAYWSGEGDYYTRRRMSSTGVRLHKGHCAVDPSVIPYGSVVQIAGLGNYLAVDTGTAVVSRRAAREAGHTSVERNALVVDLYFENRHDGEAFAANGPKYAAISWFAPGDDRNLSLSTPLLKDVPGAVTPELEPKREGRALVSTPANKHPAEVALSKPVAEPANRHESTFASVKFVSKRDTHDTEVSSSPTLKLGSKASSLMSVLDPQSETASVKTAEKKDTSSRILLAQNDTTSRHKQLYQF